MTILKKRLVRETPAVWDRRGRTITIELEPPDLVTFREKGRRQRWTAPAALLMQWIIERTVTDRKRQRKKKRKALDDLLGL